MMKRFAPIFLLCVSGLMPGWSMGPKPPPGLSLLLVPAEPSLVQVGMDMAALDKALLMSYAPEAPAGEPFLHIWDGRRWLPVNPERFQSGNFLANAVGRLVVVGPETDRTGFLIEQALAWCPEVLHMDTDSITDLINQLGKVYGFKRPDWEWIAGRYELQLEDLTADEPRDSWYDTHTPEDVPMSERPWRREKADAEVPPPPTTTLTPVTDGEASGESDAYRLEME